MKYFLFLIFLSPISAQQSDFWINLDKGTYDVSFKVVYTKDFTRNYNQKEFRPIQLAIWSPTLPNIENTYLNYENYYYHAYNPDSNIIRNTFQRGEYLDEIKKKIFSRNNEDIVQKLLRHKTYVIQKPIPGKEKFPVIIYGASAGSDAFENTILFEYLASHGYIVISLASKGMRSRQMTINEDGVLAQVNDMNFALNYSKKIPSADVTKIGTIGWSWGGLADIILADKTNKISAVVNLDGSAFYENGLPIAKEMRSSLKKNSTYPLLLFLSKILKGRGAPRNIELYEQITKSDKYLVKFHHFAHGSYNSEGLMRYGITTKKRDRYIWHKNLYKSLSKSTLLFFNKYLKGIETNLIEHFKQEKEKQSPEHYDFNYKLVGQG